MFHCGLHFGTNSWHVVLEEGFGLEICQLTLRRFVGRAWLQRLVQSRMVLERVEENLLGSFMLDTGPLNGEV